MYTIYGSDLNIDTFLSLTWNISAFRRYIVRANLSDCITFVTGFVQLSELISGSLKGAGSIVCLQV